MKKFFGVFMFLLAFCGVIFFIILDTYSNGDAEAHDSYDTIHVATYLGYHKVDSVYVAKIKNPQWGAWNHNFEIVIDELINANLKPGDKIYFISIPVQGPPGVLVSFIIISEYQAEKEIVRGKRLIDHTKN